MNPKKLLSILAVVVAVFALTAPVSAQFYVAPSERELLVFIDVASGTGWMSPFYDFVEFSARDLAVSQLGSRYNRVWVVQGPTATRNNLRSCLNSITGRAGLRAVDLIFVTHGLNSRISFADGSYESSEVATFLRDNIVSSRRNKFRMCFSTACFGSQHRQAWRDAGFEAVSGSREVYADSALSYMPFLGAWRGYNTFRSSVDSANAADPARTQDTIASGLLWSLGSSYWNDVDSFRVRQGYTSSIRVHRMR